MDYNYNKKSIWKWIIIYLIIGAVVYGAVYYFAFYKKGGYSYNNQNTKYNNQTNTQTADWKTYRNTEYGFEFKYPSNVRVEEDKNVVKVYYTVPGTHRENFGWDIVLYKNSDKKDLVPGWFYSTFNRDENRDCEVAESNINVKNADTILMSSASKEDKCKDGGYYTISPDKKTIIKWGLYQDPEYFNKIFPTFTFIYNSQDLAAQTKDEIISGIKFAGQNFKTYSTDINNDGKSDLLIFSREPYYCGTGGCPLFIYQNVGDSKFVQINIISLVQSVYLSDTYTNGFKDLIIGIGGGGISAQFVKLQYNGASYPENPTTSGIKVSKSSGQLILE